MEGNYQQNNFSYEGEQLSMPGFTTSANNSNYSLMEYKFEANEEQIRELNYKVEYWESLLCLYLKYALDLLNNECKSLLLSNIIKKENR